MKAKIAEILQQGMAIPAMSAELVAAGEGVELLAGSMADHLVEALARLRSAVEAGDRVAAAVLALMPERPETLVTTAVAALGLPAPGPAPLVLHEGAVASASAGRPAEALVLFTALLEEPVFRAEALLGLAVLAYRAEAYDSALVLAVECLQGAVKHPRACCIAGLCELERGDRKSAQNYFAAAARLARARPDCREDLQTAQRALLMMHLA